MAVADRVKHLAQELVFELGAGVIEKRVTLLAGDIDLVLATQNTDDARCKLPQRAAQAVQRQRVEDDECTHVARPELALELVENRCLARPPLPVQDNHVVAMPANQCLAHEVEDVCAPEKHLAYGDRAAGDIRVRPGGVGARSRRLVHQPTPSAFRSSPAAAMTVLGSLIQSTIRSRYLRPILGRMCPTCVFAPADNRSTVPVCAVSHSTYSCWSSRVLVISTMIHSPKLELKSRNPFPVDATSPRRSSRFNT